MAGFCNACGAPMGDGVRFCPACGKASSAEIIPATTAGPMFTGSAPPPSSGSTTKIVLIIVGVIALILILMIGSCFYFGYKVAKSAGDLTSHSRPYTGKREPCSFVSAQEASDALGVSVVDVTPRGVIACDYMLSADSGRMQIQYAWQGGTGGMKMIRAATQFAGKAGFTEAPGLGDEALIGPMGTSIMMRKGDVMVTLTLIGRGLSPEGGKKVAALIAERLGS